MSGTFQADLLTVGRKIDALLQKPQAPETVARLEYLYGLLGRIELLRRELEQAAREAE